MNPKIIRKTAAVLALCLALLSGAGGTALAQNTPGIIVPTRPSVNLEVRAEAKEGYTLIIPTELNLGELAVEGSSKPMANASLGLTARKVLIPDGANLEVTVAGSGEGGAFTLSIAGHGSDASVPFKLMDQNNEITPDNTLCTFEAGKPKEDQKFAGGSSKPDGNCQVVQARPAPAGYAGDYTGTLSFTCTIVKQ